MNWSVPQIKLSTCQAQVEIELSPEEIVSLFENMSEEIVKEIVIEILCSHPLSVSEKVADWLKETAA